MSIRCTSAQTYTRVLSRIVQYEVDYLELEESESSGTADEAPGGAPSNDGRPEESSFLSRFSPSTRAAIDTATQRMATFGRGGVIIGAERWMGLGGSLSGPCLAIFIDENLSRMIGTRGTASTALSDIRTISQRALNDLSEWRARYRRPAPDSEAESRDRRLEEGIPLMDLNREGGRQGD